MSLHFANLSDLVISSGQTTSSAITRYLDDAKSLSIQAPAALTGTVTLQVSTDGGTTYTDFTSNNTDVTISASNTITITDVAFNGLRLVSGSAEGADRTFKVGKSFFVS